MWWIWNHEKAYTDVVFFQEHEYGRIDTNAYVMGIWNHEKHETHEMAYTDGFGWDSFKNTN